jgi:hypothetical protein
VRGGRIGGSSGTSESHAKGGRVTNLQRVACECGRVSTPGPMGNHFKATGHRVL